MYLYIDESGNTGNSLRDPAQPDFYLCFLLSQFNIDIHFKHEHADLLRLSNQNELHGNIEKCVPRNNLRRCYRILRRVLHLSGARIFISKANKLNYVKIRFFMDLCSPGIECIPDDFYSSSAYLNAFRDFSLRISDSTVSQYWIDVKCKRDCRERGEFFCSVLDKAENEVGDVHEGLMKRCISLCRDGYKDNFFTSKYEMLKQSVNGVVFSSMLKRICDECDRKGIPLGHIIHDEQVGFEEALFALVECARDFDRSNIEVINQYFSTSMDFESIVNSDFEFLNSKKSFGIQLADCFLNVFTRYDKGEGVSQLITSIRGSDVVEI